MPSFYLIKPIRCILRRKCPYPRWFQQSSFLGSLEQLRVKEN